MINYSHIKFKEKKSVKEEWRYWKVFGIFFLVLIHNENPLETEWLRSISGDYVEVLNMCTLWGVEACVKVAVESTYCFAISNGM